VRSGDELESSVASRMVSPLSCSSRPGCDMWRGPSGDPRSTWTSISSPNTPSRRKSVRQTTGDHPRKCERFWTLPRHVAGTKWGTKKYLDLDLLAEQAVAENLRLRCNLRELSELCPRIMVVPAAGLGLMAPNLICLWRARSIVRNRNSAVRIVCTQNSSPGPPRYKPYSVI
jgi:hypothetical protein